MTKVVEEGDWCDCCRNLTGARRADELARSPQPGIVVLFYAASVSVEAFDDAEVALEAIRELG